MKKQIITAFVFGLLSVAGYGQPKTNCTITVQFAAGVPVKTDQQVFLTLTDQIDSATVVNGKASFQLQIDKPEQVRVMLHRMGNFINKSEMKWIYLDQGVVTFTITDLDSVFKGTVKGPLLTTEYEEQLRIPVDRYNLQTHLLGVAYNTAKKEKRADTTLLKDQQDQSIRACFQVPQTYIKAHPNSSLSIVALNFLGNGSYPMTIESLENLYNSLAEAVKNSEDGLKYAEKLRKWKEAKALRDAKQAAALKEKA